MLHKEIIGSSISA